MAFYYLSKEMGLALNDILGKVCSYNKDFSREDISITWINYKSEKKVYLKVLELVLIIKKWFTLLA